MSETEAATVTTEAVQEVPLEAAAAKDVLGAAAKVLLEDSGISIPKTSEDKPEETTALTVAQPEAAAIAEEKAEPVVPEEIPTPAEGVTAALPPATPEPATSKLEEALEGKNVSKRHTVSSLHNSPSLSSFRELTNRFSTTYRPASPASSISRRSSMLPLMRKASDGPPLPIASVTAAVRSTNPMLEELLHSIKLLSDNDPSLTVLDLKDAAIFTVDHGSALAEALENNTHLKELNLCNARVATSTASELAHALKSNTCLEILNLESNAIGPLGIKHIAEALAINTSLLELRLINQKAPAGIDAEQTFAKSLVKNTSLIKLGLQFRDVASRNAADRSIMRNKDVARRRRLEAK
ncbi:hypothetical protein BC830DRAFT_1165387 [Chytriomyces sp. MP71]|nr:hypothetical protein BC830DRAFT_1165387 [Chytriomyces sp. MP71]